MNNAEHGALGALRFRFAILADTHMNPRDGESPSPWLTNRQANARARAVVHEINRFRPEFTLHLGDIVHPVPSQETYPEAARRAKSVLDLLDSPVHYVAGNHDMGDKFVDWMPAAVVNDDFLSAYEEHFGADYYGFDHEDCRFVVINAQVLNSGLAREEEQWRWLEEELRGNAGKRIFLFSHYPPYIAEPHEIEHYDNMGQPARGRLLGLIEKHEVVALFAGHVHNFFYDRVGSCDFYVLPAVSAVRHDYTEMFRAAPADPEHGRDDNAKLGFFIVDVYERGHVAQFVRSYGATAEEGDERPSQVLRLPRIHSRLAAHCPVGVDMRHAWAKAVDIAYQGAVDEFYRKKARNDYALAALWEMGLRKLRIPVDDLLDPEARRRVAALRDLGHEFLLFSYEVPRGEVAEAIERDRALLGAMEVIVPWRRIRAAVAELAELRARTGLPVYVSKLRSSAEAKAVGARYTHFISHGFGDGEEGYLAELLDQPGADRAVDGVVIRVAAGADVRRRTADAAAWAKANGKRIVAHVTLADENPAHLADDETATANRVATGLLCGHAHAPGCALYLDTLADMDRGYFPRLGLVDRLYNPRLAGRVLGTLQGELVGLGPLGEPSEETLTGGGTVLTSEGDRHRLRLLLPDGGTRLSDLAFDERPTGEIRVVDLETGGEPPCEWRETGDGPRLTTGPDEPLRKPLLIVTRRGGDAL